MVQSIQLFLTNELGREPEAYRAIIKGVGTNGLPFAWEDTALDAATLISAIDDALDTNAVEWGISPDPAL